MIRSFRRRAAARLRVDVVSADAIGHRVAHVLVALLLAWCGVGKAHADQHTSREEAYAHCVSTAQGQIQPPAPGNTYLADPRCVYQATSSSQGYTGNYLSTCTEYNSNGTVRIAATRCPSTPTLYTHQWPTSECPTGTVWDESTHDCKLVCPDGYAEDPWSPGQCLAPGKGLGGGSCLAPGTHCGNPINVATGNKYQREDDLKMSSLLYFSRHYNSHPIARSDLLGPKWTHSYSHAVNYVTEPSGAQVANVGRPDGRRLRFVYTEGQWRTNADVAATLVRRNGPAGEVLGWTFAPQDGLEVEEYDALGRLLQITNPDGQAVAFVYNHGVIENNPNDFRLTRVQAQDGRSLVLEYDTSGRISKMTDSSGSAYVYGYDSAGNLASVTYPGGTSRTYVYNEPAYTSGANLPTALTGILHEDMQRFATFTYAANGKAISTEHADGVEKVVVQYNADGSASVTESLGQVQQRAFTTVLGVKKATSIVESCAGCAARTDSYSYDVNGYPNVVTNARGTTTDYDYNARGLVNQRIDSANDSAGNKRTTQTDWHATFAVPIERRTYDSVGALIRKETWSYNARGQVVTQAELDY